MQEEVKVIKCVGWQVWNDWVFCRVSSFCWLAWFLGAGPSHSQAGWSLVYAPLELYEAYLHVGWVRDALLHWHLWYPRAPTLFRWENASYMSRFWIIMDYMYIFLCLHAQILWESPWNTSNQVSWPFSWCEDRDDTFGDLSVVKLCWGRREVSSFLLLGMV